MKFLRWLVLFVSLLVATGWSAGDDTAIPTRFPDAPRIVAIGDLHGDLRVAREALRFVGAIDDHDRWSGGTLVVVQTGDQLDRGSGDQAILDLFTRLAEEAVKTGGAVHALNGNHEFMNTSLDFRYVTPEGFADFQDAVEVPQPDSLLSTFDPSQRARVTAFRPGGPYARMLAQRNTIAIIGPNVFVHGGVLPEHVDYGIERYNAEARAWLSADAPRPDWVNSRGGPTWTRVYSSGANDSTCWTIGSVLARLSAKRMIVGHTIQEKGIRSFCGGRVWCIDAGMSAHYKGTPQVLEIVGDSVRVLTIEGKSPLGR